MKIYTGNSEYVFRNSTIAEGTTIKLEDVQFIDIKTEAWYDALYGKDEEAIISFVFKAEDNEYEYEEHEFKTLTVGDTFEPTVGIVADYNVVETAIIKTVSESEVTMLVNRNYQTCFGEGENDSKADFIVTVDLQKSHRGGYKGGDKLKINSLKAEFVRNGQTQKEIARKLGITPRTLSNKLKTGVFTNKEIERLKNILNIDDISIFFD